VQISWHLKNSMEIKSNISQKLYKVKATKRNNVGKPTNK
jgi:hypothetical protein